MAQQTATLLRSAHRNTRRLAVGLETGAFDAAFLDSVQSEIGSAVDALWKWQSICPPLPHAATRCNASAPAMLRRSCGCRPARLLNVTTSVQRRLDDAAAGVLFGDSEQNMVVLAGTTPVVLHGLSRVGSELERLGRLSCSARISARAAAEQQQAGGAAGAVPSSRRRRRLTQRHELPRGDSVREEPSVRRGPRLQPPEAAAARTKEGIV